MLSVSILDRYLIAKAQQGFALIADELYLIGMAVVFISSKVEDVQAIHLKQLIDNAGHCKYSKYEMLEMEKDILISLQFKLSETQSLYNEVAIKVKKLRSDSFDPTAYMEFLCIMSTLSLRLRALPVEIVSSAIL